MELHGMGFHNQAATLKPYITKRNTKSDGAGKALLMDSNTVETCSLD